VCNCCWHAGRQRRTPSSLLRTSILRTSESPTGAAILTRSKGPHAQPRADPASSFRIPCCDLDPVERCHPGPGAQVAPFSSPEFHCCPHTAVRRRRPGIAARTELGTICPNNESGARWIRRWPQARKLRGIMTRTYFRRRQCGHGTGPGCGHNLRHSWGAAMPDHGSESEKWAPSM
jgi:hypothetical protein